MSDDAVLPLYLHSVLEEPAMYARVLFVDRDSEFNTPRLYYKLLQLGVQMFPGHRILDRWSELITGFTSLLT